MKIKNIKKPLLRVMLAGVLTTVVATGCSTPKDVAYFQDTDNEKGTETVINMISAMPLRVQPGDRVLILIKAKDPAVSALFNNQAYSDRLDNYGSLSGRVKRDNSVPTGSEGIAPYIVDAAGDIDFPFLGNIHIAGMTRQELTGYIKGELSGRELVKDPIVTVEFVNAGVNVMGEVKEPGFIQLNQDNVTVLDALTRAGDIVKTGQRTNVRVFRKVDGKMHSYVLDLTNAQATLNSPAYYLKQGDVVYVEPNVMGKRSTRTESSEINASFWLSMASVLASVATTVSIFIK